MISRVDDLGVVVLVLAALAHALPLLGVLGADQLQKLYAVQTDDPALLLLLRHRAVLFAVLAVVFVYCALTPSLRFFGLSMVLVCTASFVLLAQLGGDAMNPALKRVFWVDVVLVSLSASVLLMKVGTGVLSVKA